MCRLVGEELCRRLVREGKPFALFDVFPSRLEESKDRSKITLYRGLHNVVNPNLEKPGRWWTFSPRIAADYAEPTALMYVAGLGSVVSGHVIAADFPVDFEDLSAKLGSFTALRNRAGFDRHMLELHEAFIEDPSVFSNVRTLSTRSYLVTGHVSANDFD